MIVLDLFSYESKWGQGTAARDKYSEPTGLHSEDAESWCLLGAIEKVYGIGRYSEMKRKLLEFLPSQYNGNIIHFNDSTSTTFEQVLDLVKKAGI